MSQLVTKAVVLLLAVLCLCSCQHGAKPEVNDLAMAAGPNRGGTTDGENERLKALYLERKEVLKRDLKSVEMRMASGAAGPSEFAQRRISILRGDLDLCETAAERIEIHRAIVQLHRTLEEDINRSAVAGHTSPTEVTNTAISRIEAEITLAKEELQGQEGHNHGARE